MQKIESNVISLHLFAGFIAAASVAFCFFTFLAATSFSSRAIEAGLLAAGVYGLNGLLVGMLGKKIGSSPIVVGVGSTVSVIAGSILSGFAMVGIDWLFAYIRTNISLRNRLSVEFVYSDDIVKMVLHPVMSLVFAFGVAVLFFVAQLAKA